MTFEKALAAAKAGKPIRHPDMSKGWVLRWHKTDLYAINPHTGSDYQNNPRGAELERTDWSVVG